MPDPVIMIIVGTFTAFCVLDGFVRARRFPDVTLWRVKGVVSVAVYLMIAWYSPQLWDAWLADNTLLAARGLPIWAEVTVGFLVYQLGVYTWHRTMHSVDFLFRHLHQMHHSAERVDIWSAFWFHPLDVVGFAFIGSLCLVGLLGISAEAAFVIAIAAAFCGMFQHANIATPQWLGYVVTRPESHSLHHERNVHAYNYGDIPLWDMLFGTFRNPVTWNAQAGFHDGGSSRLWSLLIGRRVA